MPLQDTHTVPLPSTCARVSTATLLAVVGLLAGCSRPPASTETASETTGSEAAATLTATPMDGPFPSAEAACDAIQTSQASQLGRPQGPCFLLTVNGTVTAEATGPLAFADDAHVAGWNAGSDQACALFVETEAGWFTWSLDLCVVEGSGDEAQEITQLAPNDERLLLRRRETTGHPEESLAIWDELLACGEGPSRTPSCARFFEAFEVGPHPAAEDAGTPQRLAQSVDFLPAGGVRLGELTGPPDLVPAIERRLPVRPAGEYQLLHP